MSEDRCGFCRHPRSRYACPPGRCLAPHAAGDAAPAAQERPARAAARPIGPKRVVLNAELRSGPTGGFFWLIELDCKHWLLKPAGRRSRAPKSTTCVNCGEPALVACAGCSRPGTPVERLAAWVFYRGAWFCVAPCLPPRLGGT